MPALIGWKAGLLAAILIAGFASGIYFMWGQVQDARASAQAANEKADTLGKLYEEQAKRQAASDALLAVRKRKDNELSQQLTKLRSDLDGALSNEPKWAAGCIPSAVADRLRLPADADCPDPRPSP